MENCLLPTVTPPKENLLVSVLFLALAVAGGSGGVGVGAVQELLLGSPKSPSL